MSIFSEAKAAVENAVQGVVDKAVKSVIDLTMANNPFAGSSKTAQYPGDLFKAGQQTAFMIFDIKSSTVVNTNATQSLALYMPENIKAKYEANYEEDERYWEQLKDGIGFSGQRFSDLGYDLVRGLARGVSAISGGDPLRQVEIETKRLVNPHMALLFKGMGFREFTFEYKMLARNQAESEAIQNIIHTFKIAMHPDTETLVGSRYMLYPDNFDIRLYSPERKYLFSIDTCVLTGMEVDYAGSGVPSFFTDTGAPVDIRMSLHFKELYVLTRQQVRQNY